MSGESEKIQKKLNIAMVCDPISEYKAGVLVSTLRFAERLRNRGHKIIFIAARSPQNPKDDYLDGFKVYRFASILLPKSEGRWYLSFPTANKITKILQEEKINILHILSPMPAAAVSIKVANALGIKIVVHSHVQPENIFMHMPEWAGRELCNRIFYKYLFWLYKKSHAIIYPSEFAKKMFSGIAGDMEHVVLSNGVDAGEFKKTYADNFFEKFNPAAEGKKIFYVGRLHPEKCVDTLIKSAGYISDAHIYIAGFGHQENKLKKLTVQLGLDKKITFLGQISEEDKIKAYNACDIFVSPSVAELEGMTILEAMACGKPIIVADSKNNAAVFFVDQNGFLFKSCDHKDLAQKITAALADPNKLNEMGESSFQKSKHYDINRSVSRLENLYYSLLNER